MNFFQNFSITTCLMTTFILEVSPVMASHYKVDPLVSNLTNVAPVTDSNLVNPWGLFFAPNGDLWVADNGSNLSTLYMPDGSIVNFVISAEENPTGAVRNRFNDFFIGGGTNHPASFIFATENGTLLGFNKGVDPLRAVIAVDNSASAAVYKGLEIGRGCRGESFLFATDFHNAQIDVFDRYFQFVNSIMARDIPAGFAPFNIRNIDGLLYVTYAKQDAQKHDDEPGLGNGYIDVFSMDGTHIKRLISKGKLNSPWGLAVAPDAFGEFRGALLVGNFGDGFIHAYDLSNGSFLGTLKDKNGNPIHIDGLWSLMFDSKGDLYFTAGPNKEKNGLVGVISVVP
jgi:uncharacterized protein (TIGR03118 family)